MSSTRRQRTDDVENKVSVGVEASQESPAAAVSEEHEAEAKHHDEEEDNKIFVARNGSMGVPNGKKGAISARDFSPVRNPFGRSRPTFEGFLEIPGSFNVTLMHIYRHCLFHISARVYCHCWSINSCFTSNFCVAGLGCWTYSHVGIL